MLVAPDCYEKTQSGFCFAFILFSFYILKIQFRYTTAYGRYIEKHEGARWIPAKVGWFVQELPSFLVPVLLLYRSGGLETLGCKLLFFMFCGHYFHRTFIYAYLTKGQPVVFGIIWRSFVFCTLNGLLQAYSLIYCAVYEDTWTTDCRFILGIVIFLLGMAINIHGDYLLRNLRKPGEMNYKIPKGGLFEYISGANYFGEIVEWFGFAITTWSLPAFSFAVFSVCSLGPRAFHHHRFYQEKFKDYPKSRRAIIPFLL